MSIARPTITRRLSLLAGLLMAVGSAAHAADPPRPSPHDEVFYQIFQRSFYDSNGDRIGDLKGLTQKLDYLKDLGITSILLTPVQPSPYYHNYFATDFKAIDPKYGSMDNWFAFVRAAHARGLKVYRDEEFQYVAEGHPWWSESIGRPKARYANYLLWRDAEHRTAEPFLDKPKWYGFDGRDYGIAMLDLHQPAVKTYFRDLLLFWADPHGDGSGADGVDGFRIDHMMDDLDNKGVDKHLFADFWQPMFQALKARRPQLRIVAEQSDWGFGADWLTRGHADVVFAFPLRGALLALDKAAIVKAIRDTAAITPKGKDQLVFLENHDVDRYMSAVGDNMARARAGAAIALLLEGTPLVYYGQELGMRGRGFKHVEPLSDGIQIPSREAFRWKADLMAPGSAIWYQGNQPWWTQRYSRSHDGVSLEEEQAKPDSLYRWYRALLALRKARPELREGSQRLPCEDASPVLCILREDGARKTLLLVNLGKADASPALEAGLAKTSWTDLLANSHAASAGAVLHPMQVRVLGTP